MALKDSLKSVAKSLTKSLGTTATLTLIGQSVFNGTTWVTVETPVAVDIAPWVNTKTKDITNINIGDVQAVITTDYEVTKGLNVTMEGKEYTIAELAEYIPQGEVIAYYVVMRLA